MARCALKRRGAARVASLHRPGADGGDANLALKPDERARRLWSEILVLEQNDLGDSEEVAVRPDEALASRGDDRFARAGVLCRRSKVTVSSVEVLGPREKDVGLSAKAFARRARAVLRRKKVGRPETKVFRPEAKVLRPRAAVGRTSAKVGREERKVHRRPEKALCRRARVLCQRTPVLCRGNKVLPRFAAVVARREMALRRCTKDLRQ